MINQSQEQEPDHILFLDDEADNLQIKLRDAKEKMLRPFIRPMFRLLRSEGFTLDEVLLAIHLIMEEVYPETPKEFAIDFEDLGFQLRDLRDGRETRKSS